MLWLNRILWIDRIYRIDRVDWYKWIYRTDWNAWR
jgi:hypothetical protein